MRRIIYHEVIHNPYKKKKKKKDHRSHQEALPTALLVSPRKALPYINYLPFHYEKRREKKGKFYNTSKQYYFLKGIVSTNFAKEMSPIYFLLHRT